MNCSTKEPNSLTPSIALDWRQYSSYHQEFLIAKSVSKSNFGIRHDFGLDMGRVNSFAVSKRDIPQCLTVNKRKRS